MLKSIQQRFDEESHGGASSFGTRSSRYTDDISSSFTNYSSRKPSHQRILDIFLNLCNQKDIWTAKKYGKLKPFCRESFIVSPIKLWWWLTEIAVMITVIVFTYEFFFYNWIIIVPAIIVALLEWMAFYKTCLKNPGVMPRPSFAVALQNLLSVCPTWEEGVRVSRYVHHPRTGASEPVHYCWRCNHFRSNATVHCGICDCCMIQHDHHCPVFGGCVARNNINSFYTMIISMGCFWLYTIGYCIYHVASTTDSFIRVGAKEENVEGATRITFYLILAEIGIVLTLPSLIGCISGCCCKHNRTTNPPKKPIKEVAEEIIKFANDNNFSDAEKFQIKDIFSDSENGIRYSGARSFASNDVNHNKYYTHVPMSAAIP